MDASQPETGPAIVPSKPYRHNMKRFDTLIEGLAQWRGDDHADAINLHRSSIIEILEGVKELRRRIDDSDHIISASRSICDEMQITRSRIPNKIAALIDTYRVDLKR
jgi:hypothetical protein